ncbi:V-type proton ATPase subunit C isoform X2 [Cimex lectularius]|nr:V-type proton ATPase subunit C isoform X2 [Cimex lectularius]
MSEYWLISAPGDKTCQQTWEAMNNVTNKQHNLSENYKFHIPDLKVGTLDQLVGLSDDLGKLDNYVDQVTHKVAQYLGEVVEDQKDKLHENLMANSSKFSTDFEIKHSCTPGFICVINFFFIFLVDLPSYITKFSWDLAKYPIKQSLRNIADIISKQVSQIDADLKTKSTAYNNLKSNLQNMEKKQSGSLLTRNLADLVKKEHFILDSEYLTTLLVIVPKALFNEWSSNYEKITTMIVPRSTELIFQDNEYGLFTVTLFKKVAAEFKHHAGKNKFVVREFIYNEEELAAGKNEITKLVMDKKKQFGPLVRWLKVNFSECFCAWIHVKALRVFVESVLRYGLPVNFQAMLIHPHKKSLKRLRDVLNQHYGHLDSSAQQQGGQSSANTDSVDIPGLGFGQADYYPYVYYKINIDMLDTKNL